METMGKQQPSAIEVLKAEVQKCESMDQLYQTELLKYQHQTADATEKLKLENAKQHNEILKTSCLEAIEKLNIQ